MKLINMTTLDGVKLNTKNKYCDDDIQVQVSSTLEYKGEISDEVGGEIVERSLKKLLDYTKSCYYMFYYNTAITDLTGYLEYSDTENVTNMERMFQGCQKLIKIPKLNTKKTTNMSYTFTGCWVLTKIDLANYNLGSTSNSTSTFSSCSSLKALIIRSFGSYYVINSNAFTNCYHLTGTFNATYNPNSDKDGYIYVPRSMVDTLKSATNWSLYADQIRALEDYTIDGTTNGELDETKI